MQEPTRPTTQDETTAVRQGETLGVMRWVLALSLGAAVLGMSAAWLLA